MATVEHVSEPSIQPSIEPTVEQLRAALGVERWVAEVYAGGPYADLEELLEAASDAASPLTPADVEEALVHHPRIGEKPAHGATGADHSRREQASIDADDPHLAERVAAGNAAYEQRFGRIFLIRALGRSRAEILAELDRRLTLDDAEELVIVGDQLREIALLRLTGMFR
ncbi:2-oxo-4-hydroxy-4-carboxy-5-ureidoimidazoline decarboxylase [Pseudolysinimonas sp.]|uniref:2-oxo-4-hydroxy-4-carboxy-5-ureidoimidazoline decarboxylase n=1 Tax=Pseudolysinimonas sp. TaxID=2680009 RepID=UPI00286C14C6|nr:2-oxo-4-hydroxy-4-carboxy-5-ureidoimidazoline decarboxylase [Pseudolysinimonas sp.]